jgi:hypothetical protein
VPQRDIYHDAVKSALVKEGWTITHDPFTLPFGSHNLYVDLGARTMILAVPLETFESILSTDLGRVVREDYALALLVFDPDGKVIRQWLR